MCSRPALDDIVVVDREVRTAGTGVTGCVLVLLLFGGLTEDCKMVHENIRPLGSDSRIEMGVIGRCGGFSIFSVGAGE